MRLQYAKSLNTPNAYLLYPTPIKQATLGGLVGHHYMLDTEKALPKQLVL